MDRICKIKQYLNYINWWHKSKYSSSPKDILKSAKNFLISVFLSKISNRKKISNEDFNHCEMETSLDGIIKSIDSQTNNISPGNDGL